VRDNAEGESPGDGET